MRRVGGVRGGSRDHGGEPMWRALSPQFTFHPLLRAVCLCYGLSKKGCFDRYALSLDLCMHLATVTRAIAEGPRFHWHSLETIILDAGTFRRSCPAARSACDAICFITILPATFALASALQEKDTPRRPSKHPQAIGRAAISTPILMRSRMVSALKWQHTSPPTDSATIHQVIPTPTTS